MEKSKEWYERWESSADKWIRAVEKIKKEQRFVNQSGFNDLVITTRCGYCVGQPHVDDCSLCRLFQTKIRWSRVCNNTHHRIPVFNSHFGRFVRIMQGSNPNFKKALKHAEIILRTILADCPDRARAEEDGIEFTVGDIYIPIGVTR